MSRYGKTPSKRRRYGREAFDPTTTFHERFGLPTGHTLAGVPHDLVDVYDGWMEAAKTHKEESAVTRERRIAEEEVEAAKNKLASVLGNVDAGDAVAELVTAMIQQWRTF